jgi:hypothetical protein
MVTKEIVERIVNVLNNEENGFEVEFEEVEEALNENGVPTDDELEKIIHSECIRFSQAHALERVLFNAAMRQRPW